MPNYEVYIREVISECDSVEEAESRLLLFLQKVVDSGDVSDFHIIETDREAFLSPID